MSIQYPETGYTIPQLKILSIIYFEALVDEMSSEDLDAAVKEAIKECKFFPKIAHLIEARQKEPTCRDMLGMYKPFDDQHDDQHAISSEEWSKGLERRRIRMEKESLDRLAGKWRHSRFYSPGKKTH